MQVSTVLWFSAMIFASSLSWSQEKGFKPMNQNQPGQRVALVIGNAKYASAPLRNPENDANDLSRTLRGLDFKVFSYTNLSNREMISAIREFGSNLNTSTVALFYYSGHGVQVRGKNYLIPVNASIGKEQDVEFEAVDAERVIAEMENARSRMNIVILDACRDNPLPRSVRGGSRGLATLEAPVGTFIAFSTAPGTVASDGEGRNGLYTGQLIRFLNTGGLRIEDVFKRVRAEVTSKSKGAQIPWENSSITGDFYFNPSEKVIGAKPAPSGEITSSVNTTESASISNSIDMYLVLVQPGTFQMGSDDENSDEKPIHSVTISKPFYIGKYEVTQKQWRNVMGTNPSKYRGGNRPVESVTWNDAQEFIRMLNEKEGTTKYRLPTEAEWEFAARGGMQSKGYKFAGSSNEVDVAVFDENETQPVGSKKPNELGIYDMSGNVCEWCYDWYGAYTSAPQTDPAGPSSGSSRVLRGGDWSSPYVYRVAFRYQGYPDVRETIRGFRLVRTF